MYSASLSGGLTEPAHSALKSDGLLLRGSAHFLSSRGGSLLLESVHSALLPAGWSSSELESPDGWSPASAEQVWPDVLLTWPESAKPAELLWPNSLFASAAVAQ